MINISLLLGTIFAGFLGFVASIFSLSCFFEASDLIIDLVLADLVNFQVLAHLHHIEGERTQIILIAPINVLFFDNARPC